MSVLLVMKSSTGESIALPNTHKKLLTPNTTPGTEELAMDGGDAPRHLFVITLNQPWMVGDAPRHLFVITLNQ